MIYDGCTFLMPGNGFKKGRLFAVISLVIVCDLPAFSGQPCARCHASQVQGFLATPMGRSLGPPGRGPSGSVEHTVSGTRFSVRSSPGQMTQRMERGGFSSEYPIAYSIGSGTHAVAYLIEV